MNELDVGQLMTVSQAIGVIDSASVHPRVVELPLGEARGLRLAEDQVANRDDPPFEKSLMDGYAVRAADVANVPIELSVVGEIAAGAASDREVGAGEAMSIMTGAPLPKGADAVVPVEHTQPGFVPSGGRVTLLMPAQVGQNISPRGSNVSLGQAV